MVYENETAFDPKEAIKKLNEDFEKGIKLSMAEIEQRVVNGEAVPGIYKIDDKPEETKDLSKSSLKTVERPWMKVKPKPQVVEAP